MKNLQQARLERLAAIELALNVKEPRGSYDDRLLIALETLVMHVGVIQEAHNALVHSIRINENLAKRAQPKSGLILPGR